MKVKLLSHVRLLATPWTAAHQAPPSMDFPGKSTGVECHFPSPMHESEKWKWSRSVMSDSVRPHELQPTRLLRPWDFPGKSTGVGCHHLLQSFSSKSQLFVSEEYNNFPMTLIFQIYHKNLKSYKHNKVSTDIPKIPRFFCS